MRLIAIAFLATATVHAGDSGEPAAEPKVLLKIIQAIEASKDDELTSKSSDGGTSYHLRETRYLGTVLRDAQRFTIAQATYVRSSSPGSETPPPRGHDFILILDSKFKIVSHARCGFERYRMSGDRLMLGDAELADFQTTDERIRHGGFLLDGVLRYPFADRISDADWDSGAFKKKP